VQTETVALGILGFLLLVSVVGALILRAAIALANACLPRPRPVPTDDDDEIPDERPRRRAVPVPDFGWAVFIVLATWSAKLVAGFLLNYAVNRTWLVWLAWDPSTAPTLAACALIANFLISAVILNVLLPTTLLRACLVVMIQTLLEIGLAVVIAAAVIVVFVPLK
jgi:hypothetical protein